MCCEKLGALTLHVVLWTKVDASTGVHLDSDAHEVLQAETEATVFLQRELIARRQSRTSRCACADKQRQKWIIWTSTATRNLAGRASDDAHQSVTRVNLSDSFPEEELSDVFADEPAALSRADEQSYIAVHRLPNTTPVGRDVCFKLYRPTVTSLPQYRYKSYEDISVSYTHLTLPTIYSV